MAFSRECEYAIRGMAALAEAVDGRPRVVSEIAAGERLPLSFLSKIIQKLHKHGLVISCRGVERGYALAREARTISLRAILEATEGPGLFTRCVFAHHRCGEDHPCLVHPAWQVVRDQVQAAFEEITLHDLVKIRCAAGSNVLRGPTGTTRSASGAATQPGPRARPRKRGA